MCGAGQTGVEREREREWSGGSLDCEYRLVVIRSVQFTCKRLCIYVYLYSDNMLNYECTYIRTNTRKANACNAWRDMHAFRLLVATSVVGRLLAERVCRECMAAPVCAKGVEDGWRHNAAPTNSLRVPHCTLLYYY